MLWTQVQESHPTQWVIIEALSAKSEGNQRILGQLAVVDTFADNGNQAMLKYVELHKQYKDREFYVVHTSREKLDIEEQVWIGVRASQ